MSSCLVSRETEKGRKRGGRQTHRLTNRQTDGERERGGRQTDREREREPSMEVVGTKVCC